MLYRLFTLLILLLAAPAWGATWYVRDAAEEYGAEDGTTYATAFDGWSDITWGVGGVVAGDTLYVCGTHTIVAQIAVGASGSDGSAITIRGDCPGDAGVISGESLLLSGREYVDIVNLTISGSAHANAHVEIYNSNHIGFYGCTLTRGATDNHGIYTNHSTYLTFNGCTFSGFAGEWKSAIITAYDTASNDHFTFSENVFSNVFYGIVWQGDNGAISNNTLSGTTGSKVGTGIMVKCGNSVNNSGTVVSNNTSSGFSRGLELSGSTDGTCTLSDVTVTGGAYNSNSESGIEITGKVSTVAITGPGTTNANGGGTYGTGIEVYSSSADHYPSGVGITGWESNSNYDDNGDDDGVGYRFDNNSSGCSISRSTAQNNEGAGFEINASTGHTASFLLLINNNTGAKAASGNVLLNGSGVNNNNIYHCTLVGGTNGVIEIDGAASNSVINSIISGATTGFKGTTSDLTAQYNIVYGATTAYDGITEGAGSSQSNPLLNASYGLQGNSPAKDAGTVLYTYAAHPGDFIGAKVYGSAPDIGAYEYQDHTFGGWFFEMFIPTIFNLCASTNANCYTQP